MVMLALIKILNQNPLEKCPDVKTVLKRIKRTRSNDTKGTPVNTAEQRLSRHTKF